MSKVITKKDGLRLAPAQDGETLFVKQLLESADIKREERNKTLEGIFSDPTNPFGVRFSWSGQSLDLWRILTFGVDAHNGDALTKAFEEQLHATQDRYESVGISRDRCGVVFRVGDFFYIYAAEQFPHHLPYWPGEQNSANTAPPEERHGGILTFYAGEFSSRRIILPDHLTVWKK